MKKLFLAALCAIIALPSMAFEYIYKGHALIYNVIDEEAKTVEVKSPDENISGDVEIPEVVSEGSLDYSVSKIADNAFVHCSKMTSVILPRSIQEIGVQAFLGCTGLTRAEFESIESLCNIDFYLFTVTSNPLYYAHHLIIDGEEVTTVNIPESVTKIGYYTFAGGSYLTSVNIPNSVNEIGDGAFYECTGLTSITLPSQLTKIGGFTFLKCSQLFSIQIPDQVKVIEDSAFEDCVSLHSVKLSSSLTRIRYAVFRNCSALTSIELPSSLTQIESSAFNNCSSLTSITIPNGVTDIEMETFKNCNGLTSLTLPKYLNTIGYEAFVGCTSLKEVYYDTTDAVSAKKSIFSDEAYEGATLFVPESAMEKCKVIDPWKNFKTIEAYDFSGIEDIIADETSSTPCSVYTFSGVKVGNSIEELAPGFYIVTAGNKAHKIQVK